MTKRINCVVLIGTLLISACIIEGMRITSWVDDFTTNLNYNLNEMLNRINAQIQEQTASIEQTVNDAIKNAQKDAQEIINTNGTSIITSINNGSKIVTIIDGVTRTITSGHNPNGEPFVCDVVEKRIGDMLYFNQTTWNPKTGATENIVWKMNVTDPAAKPEIITDTKKDEK